MKLLVGTRSVGKTREIQELLTGLPFELSFPADRMLQPLPEEADLERSASYVENAVAKARYFSTRGGLATVADDSGIEVEALGGAPGPRSARWGTAAGGGPWTAMGAPATTSCRPSSWPACRRSA